MTQAHNSTSSLPLHYASFQQSAVSFLNCTENHETFLNMLTVIHNSTVVNSEIAIMDGRTDPYHFSEHFLLGFFISQICWVVVLWIVKCSILAFYWRLFSRNSRSIRFVVWTIAVAVMCWGIVVVRSLSVIS